MTQGQNGASGRNTDKKARRGILRRIVEWEIRRKLSTTLQSYMISDEDKALWAIEKFEIDAREHGLL